ncbi:hypothetical protein RRF57_010553 [Xylaria bambusicola]|uniref:Uncharacterized protein n=1 Tax=Xylaria bambusicola TaxID=326684 RepID=A0AAN7ULE6_9PEZI
MFRKTNAFVEQISRPIQMRSCRAVLTGHATKDTNSAVSIYDGYCTSADYMREVAATPSSGTDDFLSVATVTATATVKVSSAQRRFASRFGALAAFLASFRMK